MKHAFRAPAVPLIANDPMFSLWSFADRLTEDAPRHWTGVRQYMIGVLRVDGVLYEFLGNLNPVNDRYYSGYEKMEQVSCEIRPMTTTYTFQTSQIQLQLCFTSPLLLDDLDVLSWPVTYMSCRVESRDGKSHDCRITFGFSGEFCVNDPSQEVAVGLDAHSIFFTSGTERMLRRHGDDHRMEWGSFHIVGDGYERNAMSLRRFQRYVQGKKDLLWPTNRLNYEGPNGEDLGPAQILPQQWLRVDSCWPTISLARNFQIGEAPWQDCLALCYDDVKCIEYFGQLLEAYWRRNGMDFGDLMGRAKREYPAIMERVRCFEDRLLERAGRYSQKYAQLLALVYRQVVAGYKLTQHDGQLLYFSKENCSNGCIATVDITYPSMPLFLLYAPELVEGMLNPVFQLVEKGLWPYEFAPHDVGRYPLANAQIYGYDFRYLNQNPDPRAFQMPMEECGNMLLCVVAICAARGEQSYFLRHQQILKQWADYLVKAGWDPENQLCTDDFAGRLAHNCNLSVKSICALGAYAGLLEAVGDGDQAAYYRQIAGEYAKNWEKEALDGDHYRLAFDKAGSWSIKYNMVWDKLLHLKLFSEQVYALELAWYKKQCNPYGLPLDSRGDYTKSDWQMWSAAMFEDRAYFDQIVDAMYAYANETPDRVPFTDLYFTTRPYTRGFRARTVQGGLFIQLLKEDFCTPEKKL